ITQSARWGWFSQTGLTLWGVVLVSFVLFILIERRHAVPFVELGLFSDLRYSAAVLVIACQYFCLFGLLLALPILLIQVLGIPDQTAGLLVFPLPAMMALLAPVAGRLADIRGSRWVCILGMGLVTLAGLALVAFKPEPGGVYQWKLVASLIVMGTGMGLTQSPVTAAVTHIVKQERLGSATGIFHMGRFTTGALGSTVFGLVIEMNTHSRFDGFFTNLVILVILAGIGTLAAQWLPGKITCFSS
ncbi:MAG: MFS transporter, partial [Anaerolineales bacterium]|nr:MFS transporter [Anaerolineales bacterium]